MREILFRAKRIDNGEWQEGYLFDDGMVETKHYFVGGIVVEPYKGTACDTWTITGIDFCEIDPETICQYTGLKDKNGNRIWENDILHIAEKMGTNVYHNGNLVNSPRWINESNFKVEFTPGGLMNTQRYANSPDITCEIIGNVLDSPELLKGE